MSPVAVSRSSASVNCWLRPSISPRKRSFSRAIAAWSAKLRRSEICLTVNGWTRVRRIVISPMARLLSQKWDDQKRPEPLLEVLSPGYRRRTAAVVMSRT